ncbi:WYL domain-containing protein [Spirosoma agri]|uniref:WYL domain-containing protein n=1 Tax=Spirosoma agri TaxID=1987381 RepID=A0A6M0IE59_9BACT|nr:hypothetical protein [Spirosoma agri]NEU66570.1 hypothetical protein [Spirosoma agri]
MTPQSQNQFLTLIGTAITDHRVIQIKHKNIWRTVEPYMAGLSRETQTPGLYGFCRDVIPARYQNVDNRWQVFPFDDIEAIELTYYEFRPHLEYTGNFDRMQPVYIKLTPALVGSR